MKRTLWLLIIAIGIALFGRVGWNSVRVELAYSLARNAAGDAGLPVRLTVGSGGLARLVRVWPMDRTPAARRELASYLLEVAGRDQPRVSGTAYFLTGYFQRASDEFARVPPSQRMAQDWNDLAAAYIAAGRNTHSYKDRLEAFTALERATELDPMSSEARFNHAVLLDDLGITPAANRAWSAYLVADPASPWSSEARRRRDSIPVSDAESWAALNRAEISGVALIQAVARFPQHARTFAEGPLLSSWAEATENGDRATASKLLSRARVIASTLQKRSGDSLLRDAVDRAADPSVNVTLARGHRLYRQGRLAYRDWNHAAAQRDLMQAARCFESARSPMAWVAEAYAASAVFNQHRPAEALVLFEGLLVRSRARSYHSLIARILHEKSLCEAVLGQWSRSLADADEATRIFERLGERGHAAAAEAIVAEDYDLIGQPERAWQRGLSALRGACRAGDVARARVILAVLCRTEMRGARWQTAATVIHLEKKLAALRDEPRADTDLLVRTATVESHLYADDRGLVTVERARASALRLPDTAPREIWLADIDALAGVVSSRRNPHSAIELLSAAIAFQQRARRPIVLPELYLQRGRAHRAVGDLAAAERDFDDGIRELERQRTGVHDADLRPGIFDDAQELFADAIALHIRMGRNPATALAYVERGRARAMLEQLGAPRSTSTIFEVQRHLDARTRVIEYVALPESLAIFVIGPDGVTLTEQPIPRDALTRAAQALADSIASRGAVASVHDAAAKLYDLLIRPIAPALLSVTQLNIVADDALQRVPFAALYDAGERAYLIDKFALAASPSARLFAATVNRHARPQGAPTDALIFANPSAPATYAHLASLSASETEALRVAKNYPRRDTFIGAEATAERFLAIAPKRDVVQFSGHAVVNHAEPGESALICADSASIGGALTVRQIGRMQFTQTRVVVLAACSTMTGRNAAVEGVSSLARAFVIAGVPAVVGTLWDIDDREATFVVRRLHEELARGVRPELALRSAQRAAIRSTDPGIRDPRRWSAFSVLGALDRDS
jgi:CHAT domain-containing protein